MKNADLILVPQMSDHLEHIHRGKVRESYRIMGEHGGRRLRAVYASDRLSVFDFVLGFPIEGKGEILTAENILARRVLRKKIPSIADDLVAFGKGIDEYLPKELRGNTELYKRVVIVEEGDPPDVECVVRHVLTGSALNAYDSDTGALWGHRLRTGLKNGDMLRRPIFTPTTKASEGHDEPIDVRVVRESHPGLEELSLQCFGVMFRFDGSKEFVLADGKLEFFRRNGGYILCDEAFTSDASRRVRKSDYKTRTPGVFPPSFDKQGAREWAKRKGVHTLDPKNPLHRRQVTAIAGDWSVIESLQHRYRRSFELRAGKTLAAFWYDDMGIRF